MRHPPDRFSRLPLAFSPNRTTPRPTDLPDAPADRLPNALPFRNPATPLVVSHTRAAEIQGQILSDFVVSAGQDAAIQTIEQAGMIHLSLEYQQRFAAAVIGTADFFTCENLGVRKGLWAANPDRRTVRYGKD